MSTVGRKPVLTEQQRADLAAALQARRDKRAQIVACKAAIERATKKLWELRAELKALPAGPQLAVKYGIAPKSVPGMARHFYKNLNTLDARRQAP